MTPTASIVIDPVVVSTIKAKTSAGLALQASNGSVVATLGSGPGTGVTFAGGVTIQSLTSTRVPYATTGGLLTDAAWFSTDAANQKLNIGDGAAAAQAELAVQRTAGQNGLITLRTGTSARWRFLLNGTESGANAGGRFGIQAYDDAGSFIDEPLVIVRASGGAITLARPTLVSYTGAQFTVGNGAGAPRVLVDGASGSERNYNIRTSGSTRWQFGGSNAAESTGDAGTGFHISAYSDTATFIDIPFSIARASGGAITLARPVTCSSTLSATSLTASSLTSGRVPFATTGGLLTDSAALTYNATSLNLGSGATGTQYFQINAAAGSDRALAFQSNGSYRWLLRCDTTAESGSDTGSTFVVRAFTDAGSAIDSPISIARVAGGTITLARPVTVTGTKLTVPDGTAATPGIRLTSEASGLYRVSSASLGFTVAGTAAGSIASDGTLSINGNIRVNHTNGIALANDVASSFISYGFNSGRTNAAGHQFYNGISTLTMTLSGTGALSLPTAGVTHTISSSTASTSTTTGALVVTGGVGVGGAGFFGGAVTVPNGTAAAPGIRLTSSASGLYAVTASVTGFSVNGVSAFKVYTPNGTTYGGSIALNSPSAAEGPIIFNETATSFNTYSGGSSINVGGWTKAYGETHATKANTVEIGYTTTVRFAANATGIGFFSSTPVARATMAAATGTATRTTFDTTTVTTAQLAERVKALIDDLRAYGLHG